MKFDNQLRYASHVIGRYDGAVPLHVWLKDYFRENRQMGSRDRRQLSNLVYGYYRLGHAVRGMRTEDRLLLGLYCCQGQSEFLQYFRPDWPDGGLDERLAAVDAAGIGFEVAEIFPWKEALSDSIVHRNFCLSFLRQPDLFLRIRPGFEQLVVERLRAAGGTFIPPGSVRLPNGFKTEEWFETDVSVVIQDYSSQQIADFLPAEAPRRCWDACAASGGKSILLYDRWPGLHLTVSDIRPSILQNLDQRFRRAGIKNYQSFTADLTISREVGGVGAFDLILADVPCTGSGTWGRTPEELYFFDPGKIGEYSRRQQAIVRNIVTGMKKGASLVYVTCSVFREENEAILALLGEEFGCKPEKAGNIVGYDNGADSMYAARFTV